MQKLPSDQHLPTVIQLSSVVFVGLASVVGVHWLLKAEAAVVAALALVLSLVAFLFVKLLLKDRQRLLRIEQELELILDHTGLRILYKDDQNRILRLNEAAARFLGRTVAEATGKSGYELFPEYAEERHKEDLAVIRSGKARIGEVKEMGRSDGLPYWGRADKIPYKDPITGEDRILLVASDVSDQVNAERALRRSEERYHLAIEMSSIGTWDWDIGTGELYWSPRMKEILGVPASFKSTLADFDARLHPEDSERVHAARRAHFESEAPYLVEFRLRHATGSYIWIRARGRAIWDDARKPIRMAGSVEDITERVVLEHRLAFMAHHDGLTGLFSRTAFFERLKEALRSSEAPGSMALLCVDLDGFKGVNDTMGHGAGDEVLKTVAQRLRDATEETDVVARLGGDEFALMHLSQDPRTTASILAGRVIEAINAPLQVNGRSTVLGVSVGIAVAPDDGLDSASLMNRADLALYSSKHSGRGTYRFFQPEMAAENKDRGALEIDLRKALASGEFEIFYQPLLHLETNRITCAEALLRWRHPERGMIGPSEFIPIAEATGFINQIGEWVLLQACRDAMSWPDNTRVAVNISAVQFQRGRIMSAVAKALSGSDLPPCRLELEITESVFLEDTEDALRSLRELHSLGIRVALDDFGTGYSSLSYLRRFPFDKIKIDASFLRNLKTGTSESILFHTIVSLASRLGVETTAEGVETKEQLEAVKLEGCTEAQGFLLHAPMSAIETKKLISAHVCLSHVA